MFQFPGFPPLELCIYSRATGLQPAGFPHSDIKGSMPACGSPLLFAACHVLLRRLVPWHPPCALLRLITSILRLVTFTSGYSLCSCQGAWVISHPDEPKRTRTVNHQLLWGSIQLSYRFTDANSFLFIQASFRNPENDTDD